MSFQIIVERLLYTIYIVITYELRKLIINFHFKIKKFSLTKLSLCDLLFTLHHFINQPL